LVWTIEFDESAQKDLSRLDKPIQREIRRYLETRVLQADDPKLFGEALSYGLSGLWRYRVRDYRILCRFEQEVLVVLVVAVGHRSKVYKGQS